MFFDKRYSCTCLKYRKSCDRNCLDPDKCCPKYTPDFVKLAESYEAKGIRITKEEEILPALLAAKDNKKGPTVLEFMLETEMNVLPMVPGGRPLDDMIL